VISFHDFHTQQTHTHAPTQLRTHKRKLYESTISIRSFQSRCVLSRALNELHTLRNAELHTLTALPLILQASGGSFEQVGLAARSFSTASPGLFTITFSVDFNGAAAHVHRTLRVVDDACDAGAFVCTNGSCSSSSACPAGYQLTHNCLTIRVLQA
jgi:hypothetical protein